MSPLAKFSRELRQYLEAEKTLQKIRDRHDGEDSIDETLHMDFMDTLWQRLGKEDLAYLEGRREA